MKKDSLLYKMIDDILWTDWDPIGVNDIAPRDEYRSYVPEILSLVKSGAVKEEIANRLYKLEKDNMGMFGSREHCITVANKIIEAFQDLDFDKGK